jgi:tetratricopeptide (TPR) repeat protein
MAQPEWGMPYAFRAILHYNLDENELAQNDIEKAIAYQNNDGQTISLIGSYYISRLDFDKAEEYFLKALELNHDSQDYLYLARIYTHHGQFEQARKTIEDASTAGASASEIYLAKSNLAVTQKDLDGAETLLLEAVDKFPLDSDLWSELSFVHLEQGDVNAALREATKAVELNPYDSNAYVDLAFAYEAQGNITDALAAAQKSISLYPKYDRAHYILGLCYMRKNMNQEAIAEFETFLELYWDRPHAQKYKVNAEKFIAQLK